MLIYSIPPELILWLIAAMMQSAGLSGLSTFFLILACCGGGGAAALYILFSSKSPYVKWRKSKKDEKLAKQQREEAIRRQINEKLKELNFTCKFCKAAELKGPKCEYCQSINFTLD